MAAVYRKSPPTPIRRILNQVLFDKAYITPEDETSLLSVSMCYQPPFDGGLGRGAKHDRWERE